MTSLLDNLDCSSDSDDIHRLFPKCRRPVTSTTTTTTSSNRADVNLNTLHDDNDNRVMMLNMMQGDVLSNNTSSPTSTPLNSTTSPVTELLMEVPPPLIPNVNGLGSCGERRGADADDEEEDEEDELEDQDDTPEGSQGEGSPPVHHEEVPNGTSSSTSSYRKYNKHLRDSRIEIAGGREVFSQSKSKAARKRYSDDNNSIIINNSSSSNTMINNTSSAVASAAAIGTLASLAGPNRRSSNNSNNTDDKVGIWEVRGGNRNSGGDSMKKVSRGNNIQISSSNNAPAPQIQHHQQLAPAVVAANNSSPVIPAVTEMVTETVFSTEVRSIRRVSDARFRIQSSNNTSPVVYEAPSAGVTEVVVFDDIGECLAEQNIRGGQNRHLTTHNSGEDDSTASSSTGRDSPPIFHRPPADFFKVLGPSGSDVDTDPLSPERSRAPRVIGGLPIAEYEGSPRRYGPRPPESPPTLLHGVPNLPSAQSLLSSPSVFPPRPGFPQRVVASSPPHEEQPPSDSSPLQQQLPPNNSDSGAYDYLYEFSETRKVLEEFFKPSSPLKTSQSHESTEVCGDFHELDYNLHRQAGNSYVGQRLAKDSGSPGERVEDPPSSPPRVHKAGGTPDLISLRDHEDSATSLAGGEHLSPGGHSATQHSFLAPDHDNVSNAGEEDLAETEVGLQVGHSRNFTLSPETTDCDSNDIESEVSLENEGSMHSSGGGRLYGSMPVLEDGLSSGHASDTEDIPSTTLTSQPQVDANPTVLLMKKQICEIEREIRSRAHKHDGPNKLPAAEATPSQPALDYRAVEDFLRGHDITFNTAAVDLDNLGGPQETPPPPAPQPHRSELQQQQQKSSTSASNTNNPNNTDSNTLPPESVEAAIKDIRLALQRTKALPLRSPPAPETPGVDESCGSPVWVPRYEPPPSRTSPPPSCVGTNGGRGSPPLARRHQPPPPPQPPPMQQQQQQISTSNARNTVTSVQPPSELERKSLPGPSSDDAADEEELDTDLETDRLLGQQRTDDQGFFDDKDKDGLKKKGRNKEALLRDPSVLIEGVLFRARYLGSTQLVCEGQPTKTTRMMQAEEAVSRIKAPEGENQPSTEVDLFISTEKIMVLNTDLKEIMMDHALRTISYIADIGDLVVLMARRRYVPQDVEEAPKINRTPKMICHVFESDEAQFIAQSIGQAFQVAYMEFLKANGIEDHSFVKEMDYQEVLNSQEIFGDELQMFAKKEMQKEVVVPKAKGEILGVVIVESGWGSMLPTVVIANLAPAGAAARCGQLNIGDQIIAINGVSLVGLPLSTCQNYIKNTKNQTVVKLTVVPCAPVVEVKIKRPDTKYQLGFSVQNGVICSLLRGGIAERGGVRVGHRIIEINNQSVVAVPHEKIVNLLATSVGEILMKTMPTSMFRLLTGQETPVYI